MAASTGRIDLQLTDIMSAQDFHDLTGQVMAKVIVLAADLEDSLVKLLVQAVLAAPAASVTRMDAAALNGPVVGAAASAGSVKSQGEVDELLAELGF